MRQPDYSGQFKRDVKQAQKRGKDMGKLKTLLLGWHAHFGLAKTPQVWRELDEWLLHLLRAIRD